MKPLTLVYCCRACGVQVVSPFGNPRETPEICPECFLRAKLAKYAGDPDERHRERSRLRRAKERAERIAANIDAHPAALAACVDGMERDALEADE